MTNSLRVSIALLLECPADNNWPNWYHRCHSDHHRHHHHHHHHHQHHLSVGNRVGPGHLQQNNFIINLFFIGLFLIFFHRRTSGGIFLTLLKNRYTTKEQSKWIFAIENEFNKKKAKEQQQRMKELRKKEVTDLRLKLKQRDDE